MAELCERMLAKDRDLRSTVTESLQALANPGLLQRLARRWRSPR